MTYWVAGAAVVGAIGGALIGSNSSKASANSQARAAGDANQLQQYMYDTTRADNAPLLASRNTALTGLNGLMANPNSITGRPDYQFGLSQGTTALDRSAASKGGLYSGAQLKALTQFGQDYGNNQLNQEYNRLANIAGLGQVGANNNMTAGMNYANQAGNNLMGAANARAGSSLYAANGWQNALNGGAAAFGRVNWGSPGGSSPGSWANVDGTNWANGVDYSNYYGG